MFLSRNKAENTLISSLKETLLAEGGCLISDEHLFLTVDQWKTLNHEACKLQYEKVEHKKDPLHHSFKLSKIKSSKAKDLTNKVIYDVLNSVQIRRLMSDITGLRHFIVDRCECHRYEKGDFTSLQWSKDNFKSHQYVLNLFLEGVYTGGEHIISHCGKEKAIYSPKSGEIFIVSCEYDHEVKSVTTGERNLVLAFIHPLVN